MYMYIVMMRLFKCIYIHVYIYIPPKNEYIKHTFICRRK